MALNTDARKLLLTHDTTLGKATPAQFDLQFSVERYEDTLEDMEAAARDLELALDIFRDEVTTKENPHA